MQRLLKFRNSKVDWGGLNCFSRLNKEKHDSVSWTEKSWKGHFCFKFPSWLFSFPFPPSLLVSVVTRDRRKRIHTKCWEFYIIFYDNSLPPIVFFLRYTTFLLSPTLIQMRLRRKTFQRYALKWFRLIVQIPLSSFIFVRYHFCCWLFLSKIKKRGNYISCATFFFQSLILFSHFQSLHRWE